MKKLMVLALALLASLAHATPTYNGSTVTNTASVSFNNTGTSNTMLIATLYTHGAVIGEVGGISYGGTPMQEAVSDGNSLHTVYHFYLANPPSGINTLAITFLIAPTKFHVFVASYDGVGGIGITDSNVPAANVNPAFGGGSASSSLNVYFAGAEGTAPTLTNTALTVRQSNNAGTVVYTFGDTTQTAKQTFTCTDAVSFNALGAMVELTSFQATATPTNTPVFSATPTPSATPTQTQSFTSSPTFTRTATITLTPTPTASPTASPTITLTPSPTATPSDTSTFTPTATPTASPTASPTFTSTLTWTPTASPTASPTVNLSNTKTPTPTWSPTGTPTATPTASPTASPTQTQSFTASPTPTPSASPSFTASPTYVPMKWNSYGQYGDDLRPAVCTDFNLTASTAWTFINPGCTSQPCQVQLAVPASAAFTFTYFRSKASTTPTVYGIDLLPGQSTTVNIRPQELLWYKSSANSTVSGTAQACNN